MTSATARSSTLRGRSGTQREGHTSRRRRAATAAWVQPSARRGELRAGRQAPMLNGSRPARWLSLPARPQGEPLAYCEPAWQQWRYCPRRYPSDRASCGSGQGAHLTASPAKKKTPRVASTSTPAGSPPARCCCCSTLPGLPPRLLPSVCSACAVGAQRLSTRQRRPAPRWHAAPAAAAAVGAARATPEQAMPARAAPHLQPASPGLLQQLGAAVKGIHDQGGRHLLLVEKTLDNGLQGTRAAMCSVARRRTVTHGDVWGAARDNRARSGLAWPPAWWLGDAEVCASQKCAAWDARSARCLAARIRCTVLSPRRERLSPKRDDVHSVAACSAGEADGLGGAP